MYPINIRINDEPQELAQETNLSQILKNLGIDEARRGIALCLNLQVVPKTLWAQTTLSDGDRIDLVTAAPGG